MATVQRDWIVEANDRLVIGSDEALSSIVSRLTPTPLLKIVDVATALDISVSQVHNWIDSGRFSCLDVGDGEKRTHRRIIRVSFIEFLRKSMI